MKKILLTGANGYVGKYVLKELLNQKKEVTCFVKKNSLILNFEKLPVTLVMGDICNKKDIDFAMKDVEAVIHLAAAVRIKDPKTNYDVNVGGTKNIIKACEEFGVNRVVYTSSVSVIRSCKGVYGKTKLQAEEELKKSNLNYTIFRPTLIYGLEGMGINNIIGLARVFPWFVPVIDGGKYTRQPVSIHDVAKIIVSCLDKPISYRKTYSLAGPDCVSFETLINLILKEFGQRKILISFPHSLCNFFARSVEMILKNPPITSENIRSLGEHTRIDIRPLIEDLDYNPIKLEEGIHNLIKKMKKRF